jgi:hypothetical protein
MILWTRNSAEFLAAASLWQELQSTDPSYRGLACGPPPVWLGHLGVSTEALRPLATVPLEPKLSHLLAERIEEKDSIIASHNQFAPDERTADRRVLTLQPELAGLATALALLWGEGTRNIPVIVASDSSDVRRELGREGEVVLVVQPQLLTHDYLDNWLSQAPRCDLGIVTGRTIEQITWEWQKPLVWSQCAARQCVAIDWETRTLLCWQPGQPASQEETVTATRLARLLARPLLLLSLMGHGSGIDIDLGGAGILCGRTEFGLQAAADDPLAPACARAGASCHRNPTGQRRLIRADKIAVALAFANTCRGVAFAQSTYTMSLAVALGILDGSTASFISSHRLRLIDRHENAFVESCVAAGMTAGAVTRLLNQLVAHRGEPPSFVLLGRPDFQPLPADEALPISQVDWPSGTLHEPLCLPRDDHSALTRVVGGPVGSDQVVEVHSIESSPLAPAHSYCMPVGDELWVYRGGHPPSPLTLRSSTSWHQTEEKLRRWWCALAYWRMHRPLLDELLNAKDRTVLNEAFSTVEEALTEGSSALDYRTRHRVPDLPTQIAHMAAEKVERLSEILGPLLQQALERHGSFLIYRLLPQFKRTPQVAAVPEKCGCGAILRAWRLTSILSRDVTRWQLECPTCGIVLDAPTASCQLRYEGPADLSVGGEYTARWISSSEPEIMSLPTIKSALRHSACDATRIQISCEPVEIDFADRCVFPHKIGVGGDATPETYWFNAVVFANLQLTYALQRIRVLTGRSG